jgi:hypothetical protein
MAITLNGTTGITTPAIDNQGNLTVDTNTLFVDSVNNRVGVGTASPTEEIHGYSSGGDFSLKLESASATGTAYTYYKNADRQWATGIRGSVGDSYQIIDSNADTARLVIDSSGRVTMPYQPAFSAYMNTQNITNTVSFPSVAAVEFNIGGHYNSANGRFTVPINGSYLFTATVQLNGSVKNAPHTNFFKNGAAVNNGWLDFDGASASSQSRILYLSAGDYVELVLYAGVTVQISGERTRITGHLIG